MLLMTLRDLQYRARRVVLVTVLVSLVLTLLYLMSGLVNQLQNEPHDAVAGIGADHWVVAEGVSGPFTAVSVLGIDVGSALGPDARPIVTTRSSLALRDEEATEAVMIGHVPGQLGQPRISAGRAIAGPGEAVVDDSLDVDVGDSATVGPLDFEVVGLTTSSTVLAGQPFVFVELGEAQLLAFQSDEVVSGFVVDGAAPAAPDGAVALTAREAADDALGPIESAVSSIDLIRILLWFVAAIVMGAVIFLTALERERDFAVLKAVGASGRALGAGLALQAAIIAVVAALLGAVAAKLIEPSFPLPVSIPGSSLVLVPVIALVVGLVAALFGVRKVSRTDPAEAFA